MIYKFNEFCLNESSIYDMDFSDLSVKEMFYLWDSSNYEYAIGDFRHSYYGKKDLNKLEDEEVEELEEFKNWLEIEMEDKFDGAKLEIENLIEDGRITIWRMITVHKKWLDNFIKKGKHLGIFWSWEESAAEAHWSKEDIEVLFQCTIDERQVEWVETIIANMHPSLGEDEKEIRLVKNTRLKLDKLTIANEEYDISKFKNRVFLS